MKGVILDELLILVGNVLNLNEVLGLAVPSHIHSQATLFKWQTHPSMSVGVEVWHLSHIQTLKSQGFPPLFKILWQVSADLAPQHSCNHQEKGNPLDQGITHIFILQKGKKLRQKKISTWLNFILPLKILEISPLTHLFLWNMGQNIGDFLQALSLILRCWPRTA